MKNVDAGLCPWTQSNRWTCSPFIPICLHFICTNQMHKSWEKVYIMYELTSSITSVDRFTRKQFTNGLAADGIGLDQYDRRYERNQHGWKQNCKQISMNTECVNRSNQIDRHAHYSAHIRSSTTLTAKIKWNLVVSVIAICVSPCLVICLAILTFLWHTQAHTNSRIWFVMFSLTKM